MHLVDLGEVKRMIEFIFKADRVIPGVSLNPASIRLFNASLYAIRQFISRFDFARKPPKNIKHVPRFKATECRQFLHYTGVVLFKQHFSSKFYEHFLSLHVAIRLLSFEPWCFDDNALANDLLSVYVRNSPLIFTDAYVCYNLHGFYHLAQDVLHLRRPLYFFSTYRTENFYGFLKRFLQKNDKALQQLAKRLAERSSFQHLIDQYDKRNFNFGLKFSKSHKSGPLVPYCTGAQFNKVEKFNSWTLTTSTPDKCVYFNDLTIVQICNFVKHGETNGIIGRRYERKFDFYGPPVCSIPSSYIYEFKVFQSDLSTRLYAWDINEIKCKAVRLPELYPNTTNSFVVFLLLMQ